MVDVNSLNSLIVEDYAFHVNERQDRQREVIPHLRSNYPEMIYVNHR